MIDRTGPRSDDNPVPGVVSATTSFDPGRGLSVLAFFLPILGGGNVFVFLEAGPALAVLAALAAGIWFVRLIAAETRSKPAGLAPVVPAILLLVVHVLNLAFRSCGPRAEPAALSLAVAVLGLYVAGRRPLSTGELRGLIVALAAGTLVSAVYGQYQYWYAFPRIAPIIRARGLELIWSVNANFYNANTLAPFLAAVSMLLVSLVLDLRSAPLRAVGWFAVAFILGTLVLTGSRATIMLLVALGWPLLRQRSETPLSLPKGAWLRIGGTIAAVALFFLWWWSELVQVGLLGRLRIWQGSLRMIADHGMLGVGLGRFADFFPHYQVTEYFTRYPHNLWLETFAETGVLGVGALTLFILAAGRTAAERVRSGASRVRVAASLGVLLMIGHALLDIDWQAPANPILLFLLVAVATAPDGPEPRA